MRKLSIGIGLFFLCSSFLAAAWHLSVPLDSRAYQVLDAAQAQGVLPVLPGARPYTAKVMLSYLQEVEQSDLITEKERNEVLFWINDLKRQYGSGEEGEQNVLKWGSLRYVDEKHQVNATIGARFSFQETGGSKMDAFSFEYDSRNAASAYIKGDLGKYLSYSMDFTFRVDRLDNRVALPSDFTVPAEGFYQYLKWVDEDDAKEIPMKGFGNSTSSYPEVTASFFDSRLQIRFASIPRDWGPGANNLFLSGSARPFDAVDAKFSFTPRLRMDFVAGSLGVFSLKTIDGEEVWPSDSTDVARTLRKYQTNYSAHRIEWDVTSRLRLSASEGVVYRRRLVFGYLNPFSVYYMVQGADGDVDNCIAHVDVQYTLPGIARLYGAFTATEISAYGGLGRVFTNPRNSIGVQGGADIPLPFGSFSKLTAQITYLSPFVYTHYEYKYIEGSDLVSNTTYVNKGQNLGYPLGQNTIEYMLALQNGFGNGLTGKTTVKLQQRSYQYGKSSISINCDYDNADAYASENFFKFVGNYKLSVELGLEKRFGNFPLTLNGALRFLVEWDRTITYTDTYGANTVLGEWGGASFGLFGSIGAKLYY